MTIDLKKDISDKYKMNNEQEQEQEDDLWLKTQKRKKRNFDIVIYLIIM